MYKRFARGYNELNKEQDVDTQHQNLTEFKKQ